MKIAALAGLGLVLSLNAAQAEDKNFEMFSPDKEKRAQNEFHMAPAVRAGDFVFISGVVAGIRPNEEATPENYEAATRRAFERIANVLNSAGADWDDVVEMTTFHVNMREHQNIVNKVRADFVGEAPYPTWTAIGVEKLWADPLFLEIDVTAYVGE